jgi:hypothetical protein
MTTVYAKRIDLARKAVAVLFGLFGMGMVVCAHFRFHRAGAALLFGMGACVAAAFGFCIEYLVRSWLETRRNGTKFCQFTLAELLGFTAVVAVLLSLYRVLGVGLVVVLVLGVILAGCDVESRRRRSAKKEERD